MAFQDLADLDCDTTYALGGVDKATKKKNPTSIEGYFIGTKQTPSKKSKTGLAALHVFQTTEGNHGVWGKTNLDQKLSMVEPGFLVRVTFTGMKETKNNPMYCYRVQVDKDQKIEVAGPSTDDNQDSSDTSSSDTDSGDSDYVDEPEESDLDAEETPPDETPPARAAAPKQKAAPPSADAQRRVQDQLRGGGARRT